MFIYFLDRFFVRTYKMTKEAMDLLSELGIDALQIGNTVFEKDNKNVMMGKLLHEELLSLFANDKILNEFLQYEKAYEVIDEYMERYSNVDLCF